MFLVAALVVLLLVQLVTGGTPTRRHRVDSEEEVGPDRPPDPGQGRPGGPGAEGQHAGDAGTLHPPSQRPDDGPPAAEPPYRARGASDPGEQPER